MSSIFNAGFALCFVTLTAVAGCAASESGEVAAESSAVSKSPTFPVVGATYELTIDAQPGVTSALSIKSDGKFEFAPNVKSDVKCTGSYASLANGTVFVSRADNCGGLTTVLELPARATDYCQAVDVETRSSRYALSYAETGTLKQNCQKK